MTKRDEPKYRDQLKPDAKLARAVADAALDLMTKMFDAANERSIDHRAYLTALTLELMIAQIGESETGPKIVNHLLNVMMPHWAALGVVEKVAAADEDDDEDDG